MSLGENGSDETHDGFVVREDLNDVGASFDLFVEPFERIVRPDLAPMIWREGARREHVDFGGVHQFFDLRELGREHLRGAVPGSGDLVAVGVHEHGPQRGSDDVLVYSGDSRQDVAGEMHAASLPA